MEWYRIKIPLSEIRTTMLIDDITKILFFERKRGKRFDIRAYQEESGDKYVFIHPKGFVLFKEIMMNYSGDFFDMDSADDDFISELYRPIIFEI